MFPGGDRIDDLVTWLRTRIADERALYEVAAKRRTSKPTLQGMLDLIEAHTAVLDRCVRVRENHTSDDFTAYYLAADVMRSLALAYQHRSGFREEWR